MNHGSMRNHIIRMLVAAAAVLAALLLFRVDLTQALPLAVALACPLGMIAMMFAMGRGMAGHGNHRDEDRHDCHGHPGERGGREQHAEHVQDPQTTSVTGSHHSLTADDGTDVTASSATRP